MASGGSSAEGPVECWAEEVADARVTSKEETLSIIEATTLEFLQHVASGVDPTLHLVRLPPPHSAMVSPCNPDLQVREECGTRWKGSHTPGKGQNHQVSVWEESSGFGEICQE